MMVFMKDINCNCGLDESYYPCCLEFLNGTAKAEKPSDIMRSRFMAYKLGRYDYILQSMAKKALQQYLEQDGPEKEALKWKHLDIVTETLDEDGQSGTVEFKAHYSDGAGTSIACTKSVNLNALTMNGVIRTAW